MNDRKISIQVGRVAVKGISGMGIMVERSYSKVGFYGLFKKIKL